MKISEINLSNNEKTLIASMVNRFMEVGPWIDVDNFDLLLVPAEQIGEMLKEHYDKMSMKAQLWADNILQEITERE